MKSVFAAAVIAAAVTAAGGAGVAGAAPLAKPAGFAICGVCHKVEAGAPPAIGPNLWGVGGRVSGTLPGYMYSPAMKAAKIKWTKPEIMSFIANPQKKVPGTKMAYGGQSDPKQQAAIADYLLSLK